MPDEKKRKRPRRLGPYEIIEEIGHGGMARVFRARHEETGRIVALKLLMPELTAQPAFIKRFHREVETLKSLEHPRIVPVLDVGEEGTFHYYVMEYMEGDNLESCLRRSTGISVSETLRFARAVAEALDYAHNKGIIHRDIKPANIMTDAAGNIKLADFGIAKDLEATRLTVTGSIIGTADYMSPEQAEGKRVTRRSDVYSLGVVLYEMLTGKVPFIGKTYLDVIRAHRFTIPEPPKLVNPAIPGRVARLVEEMMEKDPSRRPASGAEVIAQIDSIQNVSSRLSEEELATARDFVHLALLPSADWRIMTLKIAAVVVFIVAGVFAAWGLRYRYFTPASHKFDLAAAAFQDRDYEKAHRYFGHVVYFHPDTPEAEEAKKRIAYIRYVNAQKRAQERKPSQKPEEFDFYDEGLRLLEEGRRQEAIEVFERLAKDLPGTEVGDLAAAKLAELAAGGTAQEPPAVQDTPAEETPPPSPAEAAPEGSLTGEGAEPQGNSAITK
jgi:tetratricopeptide (TPR) repeat protein